jgi:hypothetical protein
MQSSEMSYQDNIYFGIFKAINNFVTEINKEFGAKYMEVALYNRLLEKTGVNNRNAVLKHIDVFKSFFQNNRNAIEKKETTLIKPCISYSDKVFLNIQKLLDDSNSDTRKIIWDHLYYIWNLIDPTGQAKKLIKENTGDSLEGDFLQKMVEKVSSVVAEKNPSPDSNPVDMAMDLMKSGVFSDMVNTMSSGASNGKLDINKMFTTVTTMINKMSPDGKVPPEIGNMISMISTIIPSSGVVNNTGNLIEQLESVTVEDEVENNAENTGSKLE